MWKKPKEATQQDKVAAEFWKPQERGDVLTGFLKSIPDGSFGRFLHFSPAVIYPKEGKPEGYGSLSVGLNSWLEKLVADEHISSYLAIGFQGNRSTPQGKMRTFSVYAIPLEAWTTEIERDIPGFLDAVAEGKPPAIEEEEIPF